jgi:hypothetical protein
VSSPANVAAHSNWDGHRTKSRIDPVNKGQAVGNFLFDLSLGAEDVGIVLMKLPRSEHSLIVSVVASKRGSGYVHVFELVPAEHG